MFSLMHSYVGVTRLVKPIFTFEKSKKGGDKNGVIGYIHFLRVYSGVPLSHSPAGTIPVEILVTGATPVEFLPTVISR